MDILYFRIALLYSSSVIEQYQYHVHLYHFRVIIYLLFIYLYGYMMETITLKEMII